METRELNMFKKALPYFRGVFRASGVVILLFYRDLRDFFNSRVQQLSTWYSLIDCPSTNRARFEGMQMKVALPTY